MFARFCTLHSVGKILKTPWALTHGFPQMPLVSADSWLSSGGNSDSCTKPVPRRAWRTRWRRAPWGLLCWEIPQNNGGLIWESGKILEPMGCSRPWSCKSPRRVNMSQPSTTRYINVYQCISSRKHATTFACNFKYFKQHLGYPGVIGFAGRLGAFFTLAFTSPSVPAANFTRCSWRWISAVRPARVDSEGATKIEHLQSRGDIYLIHIGSARTRKNIYL